MSGLVLMLLDDGIITLHSNVCHVVTFTNTPFKCLHVCNTFTWQTLCLKGLPDGLVLECSGVLIWGFDVARWGNFLANYQVLGGKEI